MGLIHDKHQSEILQRALFNDYERYLLQFNRRAVIASDSDSAKETKKFDKHHSWNKLIKNKKRKAEFETHTEQALSSAHGQTLTDQQLKILLGVGTTRRFRVSIDPEATSQGNNTDRGEE